jgi:ligand-binding sensor domain-containing protein
VFATLILLSHGVSFSQAPLIFDRITQREGLSNPSVLTVCQDICGTMWFGTDEGVERYDGCGFRTFRIGSVYALCADERGFVWIGHPSRGLFAYDIANDTLYSFANLPTDSSQGVHKQVICLFLDREGILWVGEGKGMTRFDTRSKRFLSSLEPSLPREMITCITDDAAGNLWLGYTTGIAKFEKISGRSTFYPRDLSSTVKVNLAFGAGGMLWMNGGHAAGLVCFDTALHRWQSFHPPGGTVDASNILVDDAGMVWVTTTNDGLKIYDPRGNHWRSFRHRSSDPQSLTSDRIGAVYRDGVGNIWLGTRNGVSKLAKWRKQFWAIPHNTDDPHSPPNVPIRSICEDQQGNLWIASGGDGVKRWNRKAGSYTAIQGIGSYVNVVLADRSGWIWFGTVNPDRLVAFHPQSGRRRSFQYDPANPRSIPPGGVFSLFEDYDSSIWIGTGNSAIGRIDPTTGSCRRLGQLSRSGERSVVRAIYRDKAGRLWATANEFFVEIIAKDDTVRQLRIAGNLKTWERSVTSVHENQMGTLWVGTHAGFGLLDQSTGTLTYLRRGDRAFNAVATYGIVEDRRGDLWLMTPKGVTRFQPTTNKFTDYSDVQGYPPSDLAYNAVWGASSFCRTGDGYLVFGTGEGIVLFQPDSIYSNPYSPRVTLSTMKSAGIPLRLRMKIPAGSDAFEFNPVELPYGQNSVFFEFSALDYTAPQFSTYMYRLEGMEDRWSVPTSNRSVEYLGLAPGNYVFRVKGANSDGVWSEEGALVKITILPPWWMTWWSRSLVIVIGVALIVLIMQLRIRRAVAEERLRTNIARNLHDDLSASLSSITFYSEAIRRSGKERSQHYLDMISDSAREAKEMISDIIWSVDPQHDDGADFLARCERYASDMLESKGILHEVKIGKSLTSPMSHDMRQNLWLIFKEIIVNLVRHSFCSRATISMTRVKNNLVIDIVDNGKGFEAMASFQGNGLNNIRNRAEAIGASVVLNTAPGCGTQWRIEVTV